MSKKKKRIIVTATIITAIIVVAIILFNISKSRSFQFFGTLYSRVDNNEMKIALTFDDGPTKNTQKILDKLDEHQIKGTFFVCGEGIKENPDEAKSIVDAGNELGNHSYSHKRMLLKSYSFCKDEIQKTNGLIRQSGYTGTIYFRPPYGKKLFVLPFYLNKINMTSITWDVEPETYLGFDATGEEIASYTMKHVKSGSIILLHPMFEADNSLDAMDILIPELKEKGYTFCTVDELMKVK